MIKLTLTEEQASIVSMTCEFYARVRMGQFNEIIWRCMDLSREDYCESRDSAEKAWLEFRKHIYPDLNGIGHSYGYGKFEDADKAFDVHQVLRMYVNGDKRPPYSNYELPKCERCVDET